LACPTPRPSWWKNAGADFGVLAQQENSFCISRFQAGYAVTGTGQILGGDLPVDKYAFLIYTDDKYGYSGGEGALEHSYCSMYYYPERDEKQLADEFVDPCAHEFFHIITPLTIHSEEIQNFDFNDPKMSRHLWLYEGSTEYHAQNGAGKIWTHFKGRLVEEIESENYPLP
jgi:hypothetical protein